MIHAHKNKYFWQIFILAHIRNKLIIKNFKIAGIYVILCRPSFRSSQGPSHLQHDLASAGQLNLSTCSRYGRGRRGGHSGLDHRHDNQRRRGGRGQRTFFIFGLCG